MATLKTTGMNMHEVPKNIHVEETRKITLRIDIGDALDVNNVQPQDDVSVVLFTRSNNREMNPIKLSYSALMRLTQDYQG